MDTEITKAKKVKKTGTREEVWNGLAMKTKGGLCKDNLLFEDGKLKSKKAVERCRGLHSLRDYTEKPADDEVAKKNVQVEAPQEVLTEVKRGRGRPKKVVAPAEAV